MSSDSSQSKGARISNIITKTMSETLALIAFQNSPDRQKWLNRFIVKNNPTKKPQTSLQDNPLTRMIQRQSSTLSSQFGMDEEEIVEKSVKIWKCLSSNYQKLYHNIEACKIQEEEDSKI